MLFGAGLEKARSPERTASTLRALGLPAGAARDGTRLLILAELGVALGLVFQPEAVWTAVGVGGLGVLFGLGGFLALRRDESIPCTCFGGGGEERLGWIQIVALPLWLGVAALLALEAPGRRSPAEGAAILALVGLVLASARAVPLARSWRRARADRRSATESLLWLRR